MLCVAPVILDLVQNLHVMEIPRYARNDIEDAEMTEDFAKVPIINNTPFSRLVVIPIIVVIITVAIISAVTTTSASFVFAIRSITHFTRNSRYDICRDSSFCATHDMMPLSETARLFLVLHPLVRLPILYI